MKRVHGAWLEAERRGCRCEQCTAHVLAKRLAQLSVCPRCGGPRSAEAERCAACFGRAQRKHGTKRSAINSRCPCEVCAAWREVHGSGRLDACPDCGGLKDRSAARCAPCAARARTRRG